MNKPIRTMAVFCLLIFCALLGNATYLQYFKAGDLNEDPQNRRVAEASFSRERGAILVGRTPVAESVPSKDQYEFQRTYPRPEKYAHITGYFSYYDQTGIEQSENPLLSGEDDSLFVTRLVDMLSNTPPKGGSVQLTVDKAAQNAAFDGIRALGEDTEAAAVALEPSTGKVLAMVSSPSFNPNVLANHDFSKVTKNYDRLEQREDDPLINRNTQTTLPPGSTFKLVTAAAAIESGDYTKDSLVPGGYSFRLPQSTTEIGNHDGSNCGGDRITMTQALDVSCNVTFLSLANDLGVEEMQDRAEAFGFNSDDYLDALPTSASRYPGDMDEPQTAMSGIGQSDVAATPLQMAMVTSAIANDGVVMKPYIVDEVTSPDLDVISKNDPEEMSRAVKSSTADQLKDMMVSVVDNGTGYAAQIPGVEVGGKTGTAQSSADRPPYAWFTGFAPANDPQVAVAILVESSDTDRSEIGGGALGGPIARSIMQAVMK